MNGRLVSLGGQQGWFSPFVDVAINGLCAMFVFLAVYMAAVPPREPPPPVPPPKIHSTLLPPATWYVGYQAGVSATGGVLWLKFQVSSPDQLELFGLFFHEDGRITGTPQPPAQGTRLAGFASTSDTPHHQAHSLRLHITVVDAWGQKDEADFELRIVPVSVPFDPKRQPLTLAGQNRRLPDAWIGEEYEYVLPILGGIEPYDVVGQGVPLGLTLDSRPTRDLSSESSGNPNSPNALREWRIRGRPDPSAVPNDQGFREYSIQVQIQDSQSGFYRPPAPRLPTISDQLQLRVHRVLPIQVRSVLPFAIAGQPYTGIIAASGGRGRFRWELVDKTSILPAGLQLDLATGYVSGTVDLSAAATGPFTVKFRVRISDSENAVPPVEQEQQILVLPPMRFLLPG